MELNIISWALNRKLSIRLARAQQGVQECVGFERQKHFKIYCINLIIPVALLLFVPFNA